MAAGSGLSLIHIFFKIFFILSDHLLHHVRSRRSQSHTFFHAGLHTDGFIDVLLKHRTDLFVLGKRKLIQRDSLIQTEKDQSSDDTVSITERYTVCLLYTSRCV